MAIYHAQAPDGTLRVIGQTVDREFRKRVYRSKHFLHTPPAICIEADVFEKLDLEFIDLIRVRDDERMEYWETPFETFKKYKFPVERGGFAKQYALILTRWDVHDKDGVLIRPRQSETTTPQVTAEDKVKGMKEMVDESLKGFKPVVGNENHIRLMQTLKRFNSEVNKKRPNKSDVERLGKSIISTVQANKQ